jgi:hypothetical protein
MAITKVQTNGLAANVVTNAKIADATISNDKLAAPFTTGKSIAMAIVFS